MGVSFYPEVVYGWMETNCDMIQAEWLIENGIEIFADNVTNGYGYIPIYGVACNVDSTNGELSLDEASEQLVNNAYAIIANYCNQHSIPPPDLGYFTAISGDIEWNPARTYTPWPTSDQRMLSTSSKDSSYSNDDRTDLRE